MIVLLLKGLGIWFVMIVAAVINGVFREKVLVPLTGVRVALPVSGILLALLVFLIALGSISFVGKRESYTYYIIGVLWVVLTISFEFLFGHFVAGKSWSAITRVFNLTEGNLFIVVLFILAISPRVSAKLKGFI